MANTSISWLNGYKSTDTVTEYSAKVSISNREESGVGGIVDAPFVCGHKTVQTAADLEKIPGSVLSISVGNTPYANRGSIAKDNDGNIPDALGQEWFVQSEKCKYKLIAFDGNKSTWEKIANSSDIISDTNQNIQNIKSQIDELKNFIYDNFIWKSSLNGNNTTYLWAGSLDDFNALGNNKPTDTTFIVTN